MVKVNELTLYCYFYSSAAWRIRSACVLKGIEWKYEPVHLIKGEQHSEEYLEVNPMHQVPSVKVVLDDGTEHYLSQSLAIIQFLDEIYPEKSVYPADPVLRAKARAIADTISGGIQPLQNHETLTKYTEPLGLPPLEEEERKKLAQWWIDRKLINLEKLVAKTAGKYCVGDEVTVADCCLVPQMFNARRFGLDTSKYPLLKAIDERLQELHMFNSTGPFTCPDAPKSN